MSEELQHLFARLPDFLGGHMLLSATALGVGVLISIPLGILASRHPKLAEYLLGAAGILQTVPTLALLVLMVPLLGGAIGFAPAFLALTVYSILPILANTVTGIRGIDPNLTEAGRGLGMSDWQLLLRVQLPLAAPVIISGIRTATVLVVGTATLATPVGGMSLGNYIFAGLEMNDMHETIFGCVFAALLAIVMDQIVHLLEVAVRRRSKRLALVAVAGMLLVLVGGLFGPIVRALAPPAPIIASAPFTEQHILSEVIAKKLHDLGLRADVRQGMGETIHFLALRHNRIDCCVNYTGNVWATLMKQKRVADSKTTYEETTRFLRENYDVECLGKLGFQNAYALAMRRRRAEQLGIRTLHDLKKHAGKFVIAADLQFFARHEWAHVQKSYELNFKKTVPMDPTLMYAAIDRDAVDVICAYTSDGRVLEKDLVILDDPKEAFPPYDAILLVSRKGMKNAQLTEALLPLVEAVDMETMRRANMQVDVGGQSPRAAAHALLLGLTRR